MLSEIEINEILILYVSAHCTRLFVVGFFVCFLFFKVMKGVKQEVGGAAEMTGSPRATRGQVGEEEEEAGT